MTLRSVLTPRGLAAWAGTDRLSSLPLHLPNTPPLTEAARLFALLVTGDRITLPDAIRSTSTSTIWDELLDANLAEIVDDELRARVSVLPLGPSLLVCDRLDADAGLDTVCWPDDSSYHLALSIPPGRRQRWLDLACGSAFAPLLRPHLADSIVAADLNARAVDYARKGAELSGVSIDARTADLTDGIAGPFELVTCNAPIPADVGPLWRSTADMSFFTRLFQQVPALLTDGGLLVLHAAIDHVIPLLDALPGTRTVVSYVPEGGRQFGIVHWRPTDEDRIEIRRRELTPSRPHLTHADLLP